MPTTIRLNQIEQEYSSFEENQVLTHGHLNKLINYFESQDRLTRACALGVGVICGFDVSYSPQKNVITIGSGCGLTTDGDLLHLSKEEDFILYRDFSDQNVKYAHFWPNGDAGLQIPLWELLAEEPEDDDIEVQPLSQFGAQNNIDLAETVVVAYLDNYAKSSNICTPLDCNNQGQQQIRKTRFLLVKRGDVKNFIQQYDSIYNKYGKISRDYYRLPRVAVRKVVINGNNSDSYQTLAIAYTSAIADTRDQMLRAFRFLHATFGQLLDPQGLINFTAWDDHFRNTFPPNYNFRVLPIHFQYIYSHYRDLAAAYKELRAAVYEVLVECLPNPTAFPRHLMLGRLNPVALGIDMTLRHQFYPSPVNTESDARLLNVRSLYTRLHRLMADFVNPFELYKELKVTPSCNTPEQLAQRAIPYYYRPSEEIVEAWNHQKSIRNQQDENLSYHAPSYSREPDIINPLEFDGNECGFFRIEGHLGQSYRDVIDQLEKIKREKGLNFDVVALRLGDRREEIDPEDYECHFEDLGMLLEAWNAEQRCLSANISSFFSGFSLKEPGRNILYNFKPMTAVLQLGGRSVNARGPGDVLTIGGPTFGNRPGNIFTGAVNTRPTTGIQAFNPSLNLGSALNQNLAQNLTLNLGSSVFFGGSNLGNFGNIATVGQTGGIDLGAQVSGFDLGSLTQNITGQTQYAFTKPENLVLNGIAAGAVNRPGELLFQDRTIEANLQLNEDLIGNVVGTTFDTKLGVSASEWRDDILVNVRDREEWEILWDGINNGIRDENGDLILDDNEQPITYPPTLPEVIVEIPVGIIAKVNALTKLQPNSILDVNPERIQKFKEASDQLCSEVDRAKRKFERAIRGNSFYQEQEYIQDYLLLLNQVALNCCAAEKLEILMEEIEKRKQTVLNLTSFSNFVATHAGLEHKGGVNNGGTFVIVYQDDGEEKANTNASASMKLLDRVSLDFAAIKSTPVFTAQTTLQPTLGLKVDPTLLAYRKGESVQNFTKALQKKELTTTPVNFARFVVENRSVINIDNTIRDYLKVNAIAKNSSLAGLIRNGIFDEIRVKQVKGLAPNVSRFSVIADFCLPYRMCTDCPPMAFVIQKTRISLRLGVNFACVEWEVEETSGEARPVVMDPVERFPFFVTPLNGEIVPRVPNDAGDDLATIDDPVVEEDDLGNKYFVPSRLEAANYGKEISFRVNGQDTDSVIKVYEKPAPDFAFGEDLTTTEEEETIIITVPLINNTVSHTDAEFTYLWDFGDGRTDDTEVPEEPLEYRFSLLEFTGLPEIEVRLTAFNGNCTTVSEPQVVPFDRYAILGITEECASLNQTRIGDDFAEMGQLLTEEIFTPVLILRDGIDEFYTAILEEQNLPIYLSGRRNSLFLEQWAKLFLDPIFEESRIDDVKFDPLRSVRYLLVRLLLHVYFCQTNLEMSDELGNMLDEIRRFFQVLNEREINVEERAELGNFFRQYLNEMRVENDDFRERLEAILEFLGTAGS